MTLTVSILPATALMLPHAAGRADPLREMRVQALNLLRSSRHLVGPGVETVVMADGPGHRVFSPAGNGMVALRALGVTEPEFEKADESALGPGPIPSVSTAVALFLAREAGLAVQRCVEVERFCSPESSTAAASSVSGDGSADLHIVVAADSAASLNNGSPLAPHPDSAAVHAVLESMVRRPGDDHRREIAKTLTPELTRAVRADGASTLVSAYAVACRYAELSGADRQATQFDVHRPFGVGYFLAAWLVSSSPTHDRM